MERRFHTVLVTGGAGFIGSNFVHYLLRTSPDCVVVNLDKLTYAGNLENLAGLSERYPDRYVFLKGDIADRAFVENLFEQRDIDAVVNFAAESHVDRSILDPTVFIETNILGAATLLNAARATWRVDDWAAHRFLQVSTDEVYGSLPEDDASAKFTESTPLSPHSPYSASKASADLLVQAYHVTYGLPTLITRCSNNFGPRQFPEKLIPLMIRNALRDEPLPVYGDGKNVRDWIYVDDHNDAVWRVLNYGTLGEVYNIGADNEHRNIEIVELLLDLLGKPRSLSASSKTAPGTTVATRSIAASSAETSAGAPSTPSPTSSKTRSIGISTTKTGSSTSYRGSISSSMMSFTQTDELARFLEHKADPSTDSRNQLPAKISADLRRSDR